MRENATALEALDAIEGKVTVSTSEMLDTMGGKLKSAQTQWDEFMSHIGKGLLNLGAWMVEPINSTIDWITELIGKDKELTETTEEQEKAILEQGKKEAALQAQRNDDLINQKEETDKTADAFKQLSKNIVSSFKEQEKAITDLRVAITDLDEQLEEDIAKSDEKYQGDIKNLARRAKERLDTINKEIDDERSSRNQGWRGRIAELEIEKDKEQAILDKAGGMVLDFQDELKKDEFDILKDSHVKELQEMKDQAEKTKLEAQKEILERQKFLVQSQIEVAQPGFFEKATTEGKSFVGYIGAGATQQSFVFNFNGAVAGDDGIKKIIQQMVDELNRQATLRGIGGT
jgi:hypothetical protein